MKRILTRRKREWVNNFKPDALYGLTLTPNAAVEIRYYEKLVRLIDAMCADTEKQIAKLFEKPFAEEYFAQDETISSQARMLTNELMRRFDTLFGDIAKPTAESMAEGADKASSTSVHASLKQLSGGLSLPTSAITPQMKEILNATVSENVQLIKSIPAQYQTQIQGAVMRSITTGNGMQDLVPFLQKYKDITLRRARVIARDQTKKAYSNLSRVRMQNLGVTKFEWIHSGGGKEPRPLHVGYSGKIFSFDDLPIIDEGTQERGIPGQAINCGCKMKPVIRFDVDEEK